MLMMLRQTRRYIRGSAQGGKAGVHCMPDQANAMPTRQSAVKTQEKSDTLAGGHTSKTDE